jgi:hypothetical protein
MSRRPNEFTWEDEKSWTAFQNWFEFEMPRGEDGFERLAQVKQIMQNLSGQENEMNVPKSSGGGLMAWGKRALGIR